MFLVLVELTRIELVSENRSTRVSPSAGYEKHSLCQNLITKAMTSVVPDSWRMPEHSSAHVHHSYHASVCAVVLTGETTPQLGSVS